MTDVARMEAWQEQLDRIEAGVQAITKYVEPKRSIIVGAPIESTDVRRVYETWVRVMGKVPSTTKLTPERRKHIQARLKDGYSVDFIVKAIHGCAASDFHMARGERRGQKKFNDLTLICRNGSLLEGFANTDAENQPVDGSAWL